MSVSFSQTVSLFTSKVPRILKEVRDGAVKKGLGAEGVIGSTPVDTSRLESNWITTINAPSDFSSLLQDDAQTALKMLHATVDAAKLEDTIYMTNNVDYGPDIEFGGVSRLKAPNGMMRINMMKIPGYLEEESRLVK